MNHRGRNTNLQSQRPRWSSKLREEEEMPTKSSDLRPTKDKHVDADLEEEESRPTRALEDEKKMKRLEETEPSSMFIYIYCYSGKLVATANHQKDDKSQTLLIQDKMTHKAPEELCGGRHLRQLCYTSRSLLLPQI